ncbi:MAG TPA: C40 family peptidase [Thermotogota bacterium]|nr:C40 family peptidase [Thermotogota bacterium]HPJ88372.1 C40 family peptidase [Thermotogota bacterium]HPR95460.1 C40 family peptidase [Thermotogota bacterium]
MDLRTMERLDHEIKDLFSDERINYYRYRSLDDEGMIVFIEVDSVEGKEKVVECLKRFPEVKKSEIRVLNESVPEPFSYAQITIPVLDVRKDPRFRSERVRDLIFGEWVEVLELGTVYSLVKDLNHGYVGYVNNNGLSFCTEERMSDLCQKSLHLVQTRFAMLESVSDINRSFWVSMGSVVYSDSNSEQNKFFETAAGDFEVIEGTYDDEKRDKSSLEKYIRPFMGTPYLWGGSSVFGTDCSGLVGRLYHLLGVIIPRDADQQEKVLEPVNMEDRTFGDLIYFPGHVGMYIGEDLMLHSNVYHGGVSVDRVFNPDTAYGKELEEKITSVRRVRV